MFGTHDKVHHLHVIDFGLSKRYWHNGHIPPRTQCRFTGTARYASINAHKRREQSRRDDLEAIGHMLFYFIRGRLPWSGLAAKTQEEKNGKITEKKVATSLDSLCDGHPEAFKLYLARARDLKFTERPDYDAVRKLFSDVRTSCKPKSELVQDHEFQWFEGRDLTNLSPLDPGQPPKQPDTPPPKKPDTQEQQRGMRRVRVTRVRVSTCVMRTFLFVIAIAMYTKNMSLGSCMFLLMCLGVLPNILKYLFHSGLCLRGVVALQRNQSLPGSYGKVWVAKVAATQQAAASKLKSIQSCSV